MAKDHALLLTAVREAGEIARHYFGGEVRQWDKGDDNPVSEADIAVNDHLHEQLMGARPDYGWLSEETEDDARRRQVERVWVIDPIDGTRAFLKGKPHFTVCAALVENGRPIAAAVYNPITEEFFDAVVDQGARLNGVRCSVSKTTALEGCKMLSHAPMFKHSSWPTPWPEMELADRNSIAYRLVLVASGAWDAAITLSPKNDWDLAAADLIALEAGAKFTTHLGEGFQYNREDTIHRSVICAGPVLHEHLIARLDHINPR